MKALALFAALAVGVLHVSPAAAAEPHAPSVAHKVYPPDTQAARDWAWRRLGAREFACLDWIGHRESGWRVRAGSPSGSWGIFQASPPAKMRPYGSDYMNSALTQTKFGIGYANARYGSTCKAWAFWSAHHWW